MPDTRVKSGTRFMGLTSSCAIVFTLFQVCVSHATMWTDPSFEEMVADANLIVLVDVTEGGTWCSKVTITETIKGMCSNATIVVGEYNDLYWPREAIEKESFKTGDKYLLFLNSNDHVYAGQNITEADERMLRQWLSDGSLTSNDVPRMRERMWRPKYVSGYAVPTPSTGDYPVRDGRIHGGWRSTSYPHYAAGVPSNTVLTLVKGLVRKQSGIEPSDERHLIESLLTTNLVLAVRTPKEDVEYPEPDAQRAALLEWLMCAQAVYGTSDKQAVIDAAASHEWHEVRTLAARALRSQEENEASLRIASALLRASESPVQSEAAQSLMAGPFSASGAGELLIQSLPNSDPRRRSPDGLMDPIRNTSNSGRESMIRAVTQFGLAGKAHDKLVALIDDEGLNSGVFSALADHFLKYPSQQARTRFVELARRCPSQSAGLFVDYFIRDAHSDSLREVQKKLVNEEVSGIDRSDWMKRLYYKFGINHAVVDATLTQLSGQKVDDYFAPGVLALLIIRNKPDDNEVIGTLFKDKRLGGYALARCYERLVLLHGPSTRSESVLLDLLNRFPNDKSVQACVLLQPTPSVISVFEKVKGDDKDKFSPFIARGVSLILHPPGSTNEKVDGWLKLVQENEDEGYGEVGLWVNLARVVNNEVADHVIKELRSLVSAGKMRKLLPLTLLKAMKTPLTEQECKTLAEAMEHEVDSGPVPKMEWEDVLRRELRTSRSSRPF